MSRGSPATHLRSRACQRVGTPNKPRSSWKPEKRPAVCRHAHPCLPTGCSLVTHRQWPPISPHSPTKRVQRCGGVIHPAKRRQRASGPFFPPRSPAVFEVFSEGLRHTDQLGERKLAELYEQLGWVMVERDFFCSRRSRCNTVAARGGWQLGCASGGTQARAEADAAYGTGGDLPVPTH